MDRIFCPDRYPNMRRGGFQKMKFPGFQSERGRGMVSDDRQQTRRYRSPARMAQ
jgi:hypothetical protein